MKRILILIAVLTGLVVTVAAAAAPRTGTLVIRHQLRGCHTWSLNGGAFKADQAVHLAKGGSIVVTNNDVMFHRLVELSGAAVSFSLVKAGSAMPMMHTVKLPWSHGMMGRPGATVKMTFPTAGTYKFRTVFGEDYMKMPETIGEDNLLRLTVVVA
jgi:hypothetical protein